VDLSALELLRLAQLGDPAAPRGLRREAFAGLHAAGPERVAALRGHPLWPRRTLPTVTEWAAVDDDASEVDWYLVDPGEVAAVLADGDDSDGVSVALAIAERLAAIDPAWAGRIEPHVRRHIRDARSVAAARSITVGELAQQAHATLARCSGARLADEVVEQAIEASLDRNVGALYPHPSIDAVPRLLARFADPARPVDTRLATLERIHALGLVPRAAGEIARVVGALGEPEALRSAASAALPMDPTLIPLWLDVLPGVVPLDRARSIAAWIYTQRPGCHAALRAKGFRPDVRREALPWADDPAPFLALLSDRSAGLDEVVEALLSTSQLLDWYEGVADALDPLLRARISDGDVVDEGNASCVPIATRALEAYGRLVRAASWPPERIAAGLVDACRRALEVDVDLSTLTRDPSSLWGDLVVGAIAEGLAAYVADRSASGRGRVRARAWIVAHHPRSVDAVDAVFSASLDDPDEAPAVRAEATRLVRNGSLGAPPIPPIEALHSRWDVGDRTGPVYLDPEKLESAARAVRPASVLGCLEHPEDVATVLSALLLVGGVATREPELGPRVRAALTSLVDDARVRSGPQLPAPLAVGPLARAALLRLDPA